MKTMYDESIELIKTIKEASKDLQDEQIYLDWLDELNKLSIDNDRE